MPEDFTEVPEYTDDMSVDTDALEDQRKNITADQAEKQFNKKIQAVPIPQSEIGIDQTDNILEKITNSQLDLDITKMESFSQVSRQRETCMEMLDTMAEDPVIGAVLSVYADDATTTNDRGQIVWADSSDADTAAYVQYLLDVMGIDKHIHSWIRSLALYGDLYIQLFRESDVEDELFDNKQESEKEDKSLNESVFISKAQNDDHYIHYVEAVPNPAEMFELTKLGKSYAYIKADVPQIATKNKDQSFIGTTVMRYKFNQSDVTIFPPTEYVHASINSMNNRFPEEVEIFNYVDDVPADMSLKSFEYAKKKTCVYRVKRGESLFYNTFKIWRIMMLLQNALLLNRISKSSVVRIIGVEIGDQPKEEQRKQLLGIKQMFEQKASLDVGSSFTEYTNPGPMENNIYVPTHDGKGAISIQTTGNDIDVKNLSDIDFFRNLFFGSLGIPKEFFGFDEGGGFDGGTSLSIKSARYARTVKRLQSTACQALTDIINLMLIDSGQQARVNKFTIKMQPPATQEDVDKAETKKTNLDLASGTMDALDAIERQSTRLKLLKILLASELHDAEAIALIEDEIKYLEEQEQIEAEAAAQEAEEDYEDFGGGGFGGGFGDFGGGLDTESPEDTTKTAEETPEETSEEAAEGELPSPADLNAGDFTDADFSAE